MNCTPTERATDMSELDWGEVIRPAVLHAKALVEVEVAREAIEYPCGRA